jgi:uncharacterized protein (TIGR00303 family)
MYEDLIFVSQERRGKRIIEKIWGKTPLFVCVIANSEVGKIKGISAAGANPNITDFTPPADVELVELGKCKCIDGVPVTPEGIPTPAIITRASLNMANIPFLTINAGLNILPQIPFVDVGGKAGGDIRKKQGVINPQESFERTRIVGKNLSKLCDYLVVGESIAGGTTTALGVLIGLGYNAFGKVSSSIPNNPHTLKEEVVKQALEKLSDRNVFSVIRETGDPMIPVHAGICVGAAKKIPVLMAGGTQMAAVLAIIKELEKGVMNNLVIVTTSWIINDKTSDLPGLINEIFPIPIMATKLSFADSKCDGLQAYEKGFVREGVGAGGAAVVAYIKTKGKINSVKIFKETEKIYRGLLSYRISLKLPKDLHE